MGTPSSPNATKSVRVTPEVHARLQGIVDSTGCATHNDAILLLLSQRTLRLTVTDAQRARWEACARENGQSIGEFIAARVEAAIAYGADPGALRRIHDMVYALTRAAGVIPAPPTPNASRQTITTSEHTPK